MHDIPVKILQAWKNSKSFQQNSHSFHGEKGKEKTEMSERKEDLTNQPAPRRFNGILVNYLTEEGYYVLRKLTPEELYQVICDLRDEPTEIRLSQLKEKLSQQSLDEAVDSIIQEVYNDENKPLDPFRIEDSSQRGDLLTRPDRSSIWSIGLNHNRRIHMKQESNVKVGGVPNRQT